MKRYFLKKKSHKQNLFENVILTCNKDLFLVSANGGKISHVIIPSQRITFISGITPGQGRLYHLVAHSYKFQIFYVNLLLIEHKINYTIKTNKKMTPLQYFPSSKGNALKWIPSHFNIMFHQYIQYHFIIFISNIATNCIVVNAVISVGNRVRSDTYLVGYRISSFFLILDIWYPADSWIGKTHFEK